ncbi:glycosyltransferase [Gramella lutea]|uniref:Glycosyltransferase n=1 Tax=Christiangramia lutea TaxID=1607951 RepID=A0A9X1V5E1_9FLAO|nr:glycosyltransferase [Christiangramia lutea]MCH4824001.1 glycosyltransferase [Christiangramia lutea]
MRNNIKAPTTNENRVIKFLILLGIVSILNFLYFFLDRESWGNTFLFILLSISLFYGILKKIYLWYNYSNISIPKKPDKKQDFTVDVLTTYFPGEPYQMIITTLEAIIKIKYPHETFLCDEANDPYLKDFCKSHGIHHVTRNNRVDAKAGNINNALRKVAKGDITVILDPDHIPDPDFLDQVIPYFSDPEIGFVQTVQGYYNIKETLVARGAAEQTFQFYGPMMMTLNSYGSVNAIGANCVFRRSALDSIGGHAPGLCEDMHTAMKLYSRNWKAVYLPKILAQGLAPSNLTSYFKQQLKWARGTFDLLFKVYPKLFNKFSLRQKIHFGILPLHYLSGLITLLNFIIPIISLLFSITPWKGNVIDFGLALLPMVGSSILIRTYIQKWVIQRKERGFHLIGGLLEINTWWIYLLGFFYTILNKNIPYLPTPKENEFATNYRIIIPNSIVALISVIAVFIGLSNDYTPFTMVMSGFAIFNAIIMLLGIYLTIKTTNENNILRNNLRKDLVAKLNSLRIKTLKAGNSLFTVTRFTALPILLIVLITSVWLKQQKDGKRWDDISAQYYQPESGSYLGIYHPDRDTGVVNLSEIKKIEKEQQLDFNIISFYLSWDKNAKNNFPEKLLKSIKAENAIPMITWEPWLKEKNTENSRKGQESILKRIANGEYDSYINTFGKQLAEFDEPVYLRFAHEFDNPQYPWSKTKGNLEEEFKLAWKHVYNLLKSQGAYKIMMVWNPWKFENMNKFYPGDEYVDWVGFTLLNYAKLNKRGKTVAFEKLYKEFHDKLYWFTRKPVMLAEFGSVKSSNSNEQSNWLRNSSEILRNEFEEVKAVVMFNSAYDNNIPEGKVYLEEYIDWTTDSIGLFSEYQGSISYRKPDTRNRISTNNRLKFKKYPRGVRYKKGLNWKDNYYVLSRKTLLKDFRLMKKVGINTILYPGGNVYDHNTLKYSQRNNINIMYDFQTFEPVDFINNEAVVTEMEEEILEKVKNLNNHENITGYSFNLRLEDYYNKPLLFEQQQAMVDWYTQLFPKIKLYSPSTPVVLNIELNSETRYILSELNKYVPADYFGLVVRDTAYLDKTIDLATKEKIPLLITSISPEFLDQININQSTAILENWQDERFTNKLSYDGMLDFEGRKKSNLRTISENWGKNNLTESELKLGILKPAVPLLAIGNEKATYHAVLYFNNSWHHENNLDKDLRYEWTLIKTDTFSNPLALKKLGNGPKITLNVPQDYENYRLLLTVTSPAEEYVLRKLISLNIPLKTKEVDDDE